MTHILESAAAKDLAASRPVSQFIGEPGKRMVFDLTVKKAIGIEGFKGAPATLVMLEDQAGNAFKWKVGYAADFEAGDRIKIKATIKEHVEYTPKYDGAIPIKQTVILRGVIESLIEAPGSPMVERA